MSDYYETLGIERDATQDEIRSAYKRLAMKCHPDKDGGTDVAFQELKSAYEVLINPRTRAMYDNGEAIEIVHSDEHKARERLALMFKQGILAANSGVNQNPIQLIRKGISDGLLKIEREIHANSNKIIKLADTHERGTYKGEGVDLFTGVIDEEIRQLNEQIKMLRAEGNLLELAQGMLDDYEFKAETATQTAYLSSPFPQGLSTAGWTKA